MRGEHRQVEQALVTQRGGAPGQRPVQGTDLGIQGVPQVQDRQAVTRGGDQLVLNGEHFGVRVLVGAVRREGQQVEHAGTELREHAVARRVVGKGLGDAPYPEVERVRHVGREVDEVHVVLDVIAGHLPDGLQSARGGLDNRLLAQPRQPLQQTRRQLEPHGHQRGVELPRRDTALSGGSGGGGEAVGVPDDQGFETVNHPGMIPEQHEPTHSGFPLRGSEDRIPYGGARTSRPLVR